MGRRGVVWFVQPCVSVIGLNSKKIANITFHKLANEAERKYPKKTSASFLLFWQVHIYFHKLAILANTLPNKYVSLEMPLIAASQVS